MVLGIKQKSLASKEDSHVHTTTKWISNIILSEILENHDKCGEVCSHNAMLVLAEKGSRIGKYSSGMSF